MPPTSGLNHPCRSERVGGQAITNAA
jgi:hypothetical protein